MSASYAECKRIPATSSARPTLVALFGRLDEIERAKDRVRADAEAERKALPALTARDVQLNGDASKGEDTWPSSFLGSEVRNRLDECERTVWGEAGEMDALAGKLEGTLAAIDARLAKLPTIEALLRRVDELETSFADLMVAQTRGRK